METAEQNELLTRIGRGTPMGSLLRRYWQPIAAKVELEKRWTKRVRLLGEDLVLFRDRQARLGLIAEQCPHRRASFAHGRRSIKRSTFFMRPAGENSRRPRMALCCRSCSTRSD